MDVAYRSDRRQYPANWLLQLPGPALALVLQKLDQCSLACTAVTCSMLSKAAPAASRAVTVHCSTPDTLSSFSGWLALLSSTSLANLI